MKISLIAAQTLDGFIARTSDEFASWTSKDDKKRFVAITKAAGVMIMGSKTFNTFPSPLPGRTHIIYTRNPEEYIGKILAKFNWSTLPPEIQITNKSPKDLIVELEARNIPEAVVCGGSEIYSLFMAAGVVDTIYLTVEPIVFGSGISLLNKPIEQKLELVLMEKTEQGTIFLEYKVLANNI